MEIPRTRDSLTIFATRGERTIRWKCVDLREVRQRSEQFRDQGYIVCQDILR